MIINTLNNNNTFLFILIVLLIIILFNTSKINCFTRNNEGFNIFKKSSRYGKGLGRKAGILSGSSKKKKEMKTVTFKMRTSNSNNYSDFKKGDIIDFVDRNTKTVVFRGLLSLDAEKDIYDNKFTKISIIDTSNGINSKVGYLGDFYKPLSQKLYYIDINRIGKNNDELIFSKQISINLREKNDPYPNCPCNIIFSNDKNDELKKRLNKLIPGDEIMLRSIGDVNPDVKPKKKGATGIIEGYETDKLPYKIYLNNSDICDLLSSNNKSFNENHNEDILLEINSVNELETNSEPFTNLQKHNFIHLNDIKESESHLYFNKKLSDENKKIKEFTFIIHKNYIKNVLKKNDIIYFQKNIDDADKPLYLIIYSIKTNPDKSDYFNITIKDKSSIINEKHTKLKEIITNYKNVQTYIENNDEDFKIIKIGTNKDKFLLSKNIILMKNEIKNDDGSISIPFSNINSKYYIQFVSDNPNENLENIKLFNVNDSLIIHKIDDIHLKDENNILVESIISDVSDNNYILFLNINSNIKNLNDNLNKEILIEINDFEDKITEFIEKPFDDYLSIKYNQFNIDSLNKKLIRLKNELNNENNL